MKYNFDEIIDRRGTNSVKWDAGIFLVEHGITERFDEESIPLWVADMDFAVPQPVLDALKKRVDQKIFGYTTHSTDPEYFSAIRNWFYRRQNWNIADEEVVFCPGTVHALDVCVKAYSLPGDGIIIQRPVYSPFTRVVVNNGRIVVNNELLNDNGYYSIDFDDLEARAKDPKNTMMIICSPHNPVGRIWNKEELRRMAQICLENDVLLISDEIHGDIVRKDEVFYPIARVADMENIVVCTAINKTFNLAGLHCSNMVIQNEQNRNKFQKVLGMKMPSPFAVSALIAAYNEGEEWLEQLNEYLDENFAFLEKFLHKNMPEVKFWKPQGTYIGWLDFSPYQLSDKEVHKRIYMDANVVLQDGKSFGEKSSHFQRICIPTPKSVLREALERIAKEFNP